jgi:hypothetical protein
LILPEPLDPLDEHAAAVTRSAAHPPTTASRRGDARKSLFLCMRVLGMKASSFSPPEPQPSPAGVLGFSRDVVLSG